MGTMGIGMERGLYIAATGMLSSMARQDTIASNLANVNTVGYKGDRVVNETFNDLFLSNMRTGQPAGQINFGTRVAGTVTDYSQGSFRNTDNPLDVAIAGDGFFMVQTTKPGNPIEYTRNGQFTRSADGYLMTQKGEYVLSSARQRMFVGAGDPVITQDGRVYTADQQLSGQLGIMRLDIENGATRKVGDNNWAGPELGLATAPATQVRQRFVEASGVNSIKEMIEMITTMRGYEASQRAVMAIDGTLDKAVNSVGTLG